MWLARCASSRLQDLSCHCTGPIACGVCCTRASRSGLSSAGIDTWEENGLCEVSRLGRATGGKGTGGCIPDDAQVA